MPFFTKNDPDFVSIIVDSLAFFNSRDDFIIHAISIMPNHVHLLISMIDIRYEFQIRFFRFTTKKILEANKQRALENRVHFEVNRCDRKHQVWRKRFKDIRVRDARAFYAIQNYIKRNPESKYWKNRCCDQSFPSLKISPRFPN